MVINKAIIGVHSLQYGRVVCLAFSDGSVEYRDRFTLQEIYNEMNLERIMSLNQVGFTFQDDSPCEPRLCFLFATSAYTTLQVYKQPCPQPTVPWSRYRTTGK